MDTKIHIRSPKDGRYLDERGCWSPRVLRARTFTNAIDAEQFCREQKIHEVEFVIIRGEHRPLTVRFKWTA